MATKMKFTPAAVARLKPPASGRDEYSDTEQKQLRLRVAADGKMSWCFYGRVNGTPSRRKLGDAAAMTPAAARRACVKYFAGVVGGTDPLAAKRQRAAAPTLGELYARWFEICSKHLARVRDYQWIWDKHFPPLAKRKLEDIQPIDVARWHGRIGEASGEVAANRCARFLSTLYGKTEELIGVQLPNPCRRLKRFREESRTRFLSEKELLAFFEAVQKRPQLFRDLFHTLLLTGQRRGNVQRMKWCDVDMERGVWTIPAAESKNRRTTVVFLVEFVVGILERRSRLAHNEWVFPKTTTGEPVRDLRWHWEKILVDAQLENLHPHDLRRSFASWQAMRGVSLTSIARSLGHSGNTSVGIYARLSGDVVEDGIRKGTQAMLEYMPADAGESRSYHGHGGSAPSRAKKV